MASVDRAGGGSADRAAEAERASRASQADERNNVNEAGAANAVSPDNVTDATSPEGPSEAEQLSRDASAALRETRAQRAQEFQATGQRPEFVTGPGGGLQQAQLERALEQRVEPQEVVDTNLVEQGVALENVDAVDPEVQALQEQFATDPVVASQELASQVEALETIEAREALVGQYETQIAESIAQIDRGGFDSNTSNEVMANITRTAELAGVDAAQGIADATMQAITAQQPEHMQGLGAGTGLSESITHSVEQGAGTLLGGELARAAAGIDSNLAASHIDRAVAQGVGTLRDNVAQAQENVAALEAQWQRQSTELIGRLSPDQMQTAREAFEARHSDTFQAYEQAVENLGTTMSGLGNIAERPIESNASIPIGAAMQREATRVAESALSLQSTEAGLRAIAEQVANQGQQQPNLLNQIGNAAKQIDGTTKAAALLISNATAHGALRAAANGNDVLSNRLLDGLQRSADIFGLPQERMDGITDALRQVQGSSTDAAREAAARELARQMDVGGLDVGVGGQRISGALGAIGGAFTLGQSLRGITDGQMDPNGLAAELQHYVNAVGGGIDTAVGIANMVGHSSRLLRGAEVFGARVLGPIGGVLDGALAINYAQNGEYTRAALSGLSAAGAVAMAIPGGQLVGAGLIAAGVVGGFAHDAWNARQDRINLEADFANTFEALGFSSAQAEHLSQTNNGVPAFSGLYDFLGGNTDAFAQLQGMTTQGYQNNQEILRTAQHVDTMLQAGTQMYAPERHSAAGAAMLHLAETGTPVQAQQALQHLHNAGWTVERLQAIQQDLRQQPAANFGFTDPYYHAEQFQRGLQALLQAAGQ